MVKTLKAMKELVELMVAEMRKKYSFMEVRPNMVEEFIRLTDSVDTDWCFDYIMSQYGDEIEVEY